MGRKMVKGLSLVGQEKVPHSFGLRIGDLVATTGAIGGLPAERGLLERTKGLPEPQTSISLPDTRYPGLGTGEGRPVCVCGYSKGLWDLNEDIKPLLLSVCNFSINNSFPFHQSLALRAVIPWRQAR